jgi:ABC-type lipoprotein release transport system permease subunit
LRYVPPEAIVAMIIVVPAALALVNALALGPGRRAARLQPAQVLRAE